MTSVTGGDQRDERQRAVTSASAVFDLLIDAVDGPGTRDQRQGRGGAAAPAGPGRESRPGDAGLDGFRSAVMQSVDLYSELLQRVLGLYVDAVQGRLERATVPPAAVNVPVQLVGQPGTSSRARLWVHNATPDALAGIRLLLTDLFAHDGSRLVGCAGFDPAVLQVPPGGSAACWLEIAIPDDTGGGTYHGYALATGLPEASVPVRLVVGA